MVSVDWDLSNPGKWKYIPPKIMAKFPHQTDVQFVILPPNVDCELIAARMEIRVQELIEEARKVTIDWFGIQIFRVVYANK